MSQALTGSTTADYGPRRSPRGAGAAWRVLRSLPDLGIGQYWFVAPEGADREPDRLDDGVDTFAAAPDGIVVVDEVGSDHDRERPGRRDVRLYARRAGRPSGRDPAAGPVPRTARQAPPGLHRPARLGDRWARRCRCTGAARAATSSRSTSASTTSATTTRGLRVIAFVRDATARRRMEEELRDERGRLPAPRRRRRRSRDLHARPVGPSHDVEPGRGAHQGVARRRDPRPALLGVLPPRRRRLRSARARPRTRRGRGPRAERGMARARERSTVLGRDHALGGPRRQRHAARLRQGDTRTGPRATRPAPASNRSASSIARCSNDAPKTRCSRSSRRAPGRWSVRPLSLRGRSLTTASSSPTPKATAPRPFSGAVRRKTPS